MWFHTLFILVCTAERPLYPGAPISCNESWKTVYEFSVSNRLTDAATQDLLQLIGKHCPLPNHCIQSIHKLKKYSTMEGEISNKHYCSICMKELLLSQGMCAEQNCRDQKSSVCYFTLLPFGHHLKDIFTGTYVQA